MKLDHVVFRVDDLAESVALFRQLGFTVVLGGKHRNGLTENALIYFRDETFLELLAFCRPRLVRLLTRSGLSRLKLRKRAGHIRYRFAQTINYPPGLVDAAVIQDDLNLVSQTMGLGLIRHVGQQGASRITPDGTSVSWNMLCPIPDSLPFWRDAYKPSLAVTGTDRKHVNGASGICKVHYAVKDLFEVRKYWQAIGGKFAKTAECDSGKYFQLLNFPLEYHTADSNPKWNKWVASTRDRPVRLTLFTDRNGAKQELSLPTHWQAEIGFE